MIDLNNLEEIKKLDPKNVYGSTGMLADQCEYIWKLSKTVDFTDEYKSAENIILCGMGGSAYGGYVAYNLFFDSIKAPLITLSDYHLPGFANEKSLIILSSYSGDTEEPLNCAQEALSQNINLTGITGGGKALKILKSRNSPSIIFDQKYNPSGQPRLGTGYMVLGTIALLNRLGYISVSDEEVTDAISQLRNNNEYVKSKSIEIAQKVYNNIPVIFAAEFLNGNIHIIRNQINETAKSFSAFSELPELNHHLMEGLKNPSDKKLIVLFINSSLYSGKLKKRLDLTKDVVEKNKILRVEYKPLAKTKIAQMLEVLSFGGYFTLNLGLLYGQDPSLIPWVDYFKEQLTKS